MRENVILLRSACISTSLPYLVRQRLCMGKVSKQDMPGTSGSVSTQLVKEVAARLRQYALVISQQGHWASSMPIPKSSVSQRCSYAPEAKDRQFYLVSKFLTASP